ncbi:hypothetical protein SDC9_188261 [bioreactor metagenome]|uniref:Uncharacterized protein n=1 Tax=bioreactor metagenome TaxID=1076179 RepID=A0A645HQK0_9ZZZZ
MQMIAGRGAGGAHIADNLPLLDDIINLDGAGIEMGIQAGHAVVVLDDHIVPVGIAVS